jgi:D-cysteine desulfhydrase
MLPPSRLTLARLPTPIHRLGTVSKNLGKEVYLWRDDLTGFIDSGNKLRKLEFLVADALAQGADHLITCGGPQSNHTRATAAVARSLGLGISILILPKLGFDRAKPPNANLLLDQIFDADITWINPEDFVRHGSSYDAFFEQETTRLKALGKKPYAISLGGSSPIGCKGYLHAVEEMLATWTKLVPNSLFPDDLFCALGSGGTYVGLQMGIQSQNIPTKLHGVNVIGPIATAHQYVNKLTHDSIAAGMQFESEKNAEMIDGYVGAGYAIASDADLEFYSTLARDEGVLLDPCYTGKAFQGMLSEIKKDPSRFGKQILFLHSGGVFANFAYAEQFQTVFRKKRASS